MHGEQKTRIAHARQLPPEPTSIQDTARQKTHAQTQSEEPAACRWRRCPCFSQQTLPKFPKVDCRSTPTPPRRAPPITSRLSLAIPLCDPRARPVARALGPPAPIPPPIYLPPTPITPATTLHSTQAHRLPPASVSPSAPCNAPPRGFPRHPPNTAHKMPPRRSFS